MFNLSAVSTAKTLESKFVKPFSLDYTLNGYKKRWDLIETHNCVSVLIYNSTRKVLVFVRQFRPAVYYNSIPLEDRKNPVDTEKYPVSLGLTLELCAGIIDKDKPIEEIAREEVLEECGYDMPIKNLRQIKRYRGAVGVSGEQHTLFYAEVTDDMKVTQGGGVTLEGEFIQVVEMGLSEAKRKFMEEEDLIVPPGCLLAVTWFFSNLAASL